jgi:transposase
MRFVAVKSEAQQARAMLFRTRDLLVRQRTQLINALRGHLAEHGVVAARGPAHVKRLADAIANNDSCLPIAVRELGELLLEQIAALNEKTRDLDKRLRDAAGRDGATKRLQTMPGVVRSPQWLSKRLRHQWKSFAEVGTLRPGSGSCRYSGPLAASRGSEKPPRWASGISAGS